MKLYLVRHGECISSAVDPEQPLSEIGVTETKALAKRLQSYNLEIDEILHSSKLRAKQTAEIFAQTLAPDATLLQREGLKPMDETAPLLDEVRYYDQNVMIVSHLPFLEKLLSKLLMHDESKSFVRFDASTVICLSKTEQSYEILWVMPIHL